MTTSSNPGSELPLPVSPIPAAATATYLSPEGHDPESTERVKIRGRLRRLMLSMLFLNIGVTFVVSAVPQVLLPLQIQALDPAHKTINLAIVTTLGGLGTIVFTPLIGRLSDWTRGRFGRRAPWMLGCAVVAGVAMLALGTANGLLEITLGWVVALAAISGTQNLVTTLLPDRIPRGVRGVVSSMLGLGTMVGAIGGSIIAASFASKLAVGYYVFGGIAVLLTILFVVLNPDHSNRTEPRSPLRFGELARSFWVDPREHRDFAWAFAGRMLLYLGYFVITSYQLYLLQDYIGLKDKAVATYPIINVVTLIGIVVSTLVAGPISDRIGRRKPVVVVAGVLMAIAFVFPWVSPTVGGEYAWALIAGLGFGAYQSVDTALISEVLPRSGDYGKDIGIVSIAAGIPATVSPAIAGAVVVTVGYAALFPLAAVLGLAGTFAVLRIRSVR